MATKLEGIAVKARAEKDLRFTSLCHHITRELIGESLNRISPKSAPGIDGITVSQAKEDFHLWVEEMLRSIHRKGYKAPAVKRVWIPKPGKSEERPLGVPCITDRALQRSVTKVLEAIYEQDFLACSFGGRPNLSAHHALATFNEIVSGKYVNWVLEADLKNFFGSLSQQWLIRFVEHRVGDPRIISLIRRWLKAGILENGEIHLSDSGVPQGGSISVLLSNIYLHYVLDLWFEKVVKPKLKGEAYLIRYIDDFVVCFKHRSDARMFQEGLQERLEKFSLELAPTKTRLVEFGRFAQRNAVASGKKTETVYFLGFTHFCARNLKGNFMVGRKTEKTRFKRSVEKIYALLKDIRHFSIKDQREKINQVLRGHYAYYGMGGNTESINRIHRLSQKYWRKMLNSRGRKRNITWEKFNKLLALYPLQAPRQRMTFKKMKAIAVL